MGIETILIVLGVAIVIAIAVGVRKTKKKVGNTSVADQAPDEGYPRK